MEVGDWLRAGCTLPIIFALAWSMFTILRHECGGQQERSCRQLRKLVCPVWLNASFEASQQAETRSERPSRRSSAAGRGGHAARKDSPKSSTRSTASTERGIAVYGETLKKRQANTLERERSKSDPFPTAAAPAAKVVRQHSAPAGPCRLSFSVSYTELAQSSCFNELADLTCQRLNISRFELWRNKAVWVSLKQAWQKIESGRATASDADRLNSNLSAMRESVHLVSDAILEDGRAARQEVTKHLLARMRGAQPGAVWHVGGARRMSPPSTRPSGRQDSGESSMPPPQLEDASILVPGPVGPCHASAADGIDVRQIGAKQGGEGGARVIMKPRVITTPAFERLLSRGASAW